jgi:hypothetical protein
MSGRISCTDVDAEHWWTHHIHRCLVAVADGWMGGTDDAANQKPKTKKPVGLGRQNKTGGRASYWFWFCLDRADPRRRGREHGTPHAPSRLVLLSKFPSSSWHRRSSIPMWLPQFLFLTLYDKTNSEPV